MSGIDLTRGRGKVEGVSGWECVDEMQGSQRVRECVAKMQVDSGWSQRVWDGHWVLGADSDDLGMM